MFYIYSFTWLGYVKNTAFKFETGRNVRHISFVMF